MATSNEPRETIFTTPSDLEVAIARVFDAPRSVVWDAWTLCEHVTQWMLGPDGWTMPICEIDLRPGGAYRYGWSHVDGSEMEIRGEYREVAPPERLVLTESWGGNWPETVNTVVLSEEGGRTHMSCTMLYPSKDARDAAMQTGIKAGVTASYNRLSAYLRTLD
jgi:uncharacterized protein YndB with AHSA1/START domain